MAKKKQRVTKEKWRRPMLYVLTRGRNRHESVLALCKTGEPPFGVESDPGASWRKCEKYLCSPNCFDRSSS